MAERMLFIGWGQVARGREERALEVFNETLGLYGRMQQAGRIESFDVALLDPNDGLDGYVALRGSAQQMAAVRQDDEFRRVMNDAALIVDRLQIVDGVCDKGVEKEIATYQEAVSKVPQTV
jgi:hypothetical protein